MSKWTRQLHRWLSIAFTVNVVIVTAAVVTQPDPAVWISLTPLLPLGLLMLTGLYLFTLPYARKWRRRSGSDTTVPLEAG